MRVNHMDYMLGDPEGAWEAQDEEDWEKEPRGTKYEVIVRFLVEATDPEDAENSVNDVIKEGILRLIDDEREPIEEYDIDNIEPADFL